MKKKIIIKSSEELALENMGRDLKDIRERFETGRLPKNPTRSFEVGEPVRYGAFGDSWITEIIDGGLIYKFHSDYTGQEYGRPIHLIKDTYAEWNEIFKVTTDDDTRERNHLREIDDVQIRFYNNDIHSLLHKVYNSGVDFNPDYQRDLVWTLEQKQALIESIFKNVDIGKFTFILHDYSRELFYEILDGKQRLTTLCQYYEDRFEYRGKKFTELSFYDRHHFTGHPIIQGEVGEISQKQIYKLFLKMNTSGTPISQEHLDRIRKLYEES